MSRVEKQGCSKFKNMTISSSSSSSSSSSQNCKAVNRNLERGQRLLSQETGGLHDLLYRPFPALWSTNRNKKIRLPLQDASNVLGEKKRNRKREFSAIITMQRGPPAFLLPQGVHSNQALRRRQRLPQWSRRKPLTGSWSLTGKNREEF